MVDSPFSTLDGRRVINADDFGILWNGEEVGCYKKIHAEERFVGLGEKQGTSIEDKQPLAIGIQTISVILKVHASSIRRFLLYGL